MNHSTALSELEALLASERSYVRERSAIDPRLAVVELSRVMDVF